MSEDYIVIGQDAATIGANASAGAVHVYDAATRTLLRTLSEPSPNRTGWFGEGVATAGDYILAGAYGRSQAAHLFDAATGALLHSFAPAAPDTSDNYGFNVAVSATHSLVGAFGADGPVAEAGRAYLYDNVSGALAQEFVSPDPQFGGWFGADVALSPGMALVGAVHEGGAAGVNDSGAAYLFDTADGALLRSFYNPDPEAFDYFGNSVALDDGFALIGAHGDEAAGVNAGAAYLFDAATGALLHRLSAPETDDYDQFGFDVALADGKALVGAYTRDGGVGAAYLFDALTGELLQSFTNPDGAEADNFAESVALSAGFAVFGAQRDDTAAGSGSAYAFELASATQDVPAPPAALLLPAGLAALALRRRSRRRG